MSNEELCAGCLRDGEEIKADAWCSECSEYVCKPCGRAHRRFIVPHKLVDKTHAQQLQNVFEKLPSYCEIHPDQKVILFCCQHDQLMCASCVPNFHSNCISVISVEKASNGVRDGFALKSVEERTSSLIKVLQDMISEIDANNSQLEFQKEFIRQKIIDTKKEISKHLDKIEEELCSDLVEKYSFCSDKINTSKAELQFKHDAVISLERDLNILKSDGSDLQLFKAMKHFDRKLHIKETDLKTLQTKLTLLTLEYESLGDTLECYSILPILGKVSIKGMHLKTPVQQEIQGQIASSSNDFLPTVENDACESRRDDIEEETNVCPKCQEKFPDLDSLQIHILDCIEN